MKIKLLTLSLLMGGSITNLWSMDALERLGIYYYKTATQSVKKYIEPKKEQINKLPSNPTANTAEAHACNVITILMEDLRAKKLTIKNVESCIIQIARNKKTKKNVELILENKYPELYKKTYIGYSSKLPEGCHAVLEALVKYNYEPEKAKL